MALLESCPVTRVLVTAPGRRWAGSDMMVALPQPASGPGVRVGPTVPTAAAAARPGGRAREVDGAPCQRASGQCPAVAAAAAALACRIKPDSDGPTRTAGGPCQAGPG